jgi:hypothetical protein
MRAAWDLVVGVALVAGWVLMHVGWLWRMAMAPMPWADLQEPDA